MEGREGSWTTEGSVESSIIDSGGSGVVRTVLEVKSGFGGCLLIPRNCLNARKGSIIASASKIAGSTGEGLGPGVNL